MFIRQMDRTQQLLKSLLQKYLASTNLFSPLEAELTNVDSTHTSYKPLILTAFLKKGLSFDGVLVSNKYTRKGFLPFLGDELNWLTGTSTTKDVSSIKKRINRLPHGTTNRKL